MACNSEKCHCPACDEERRLKGLEHRVDVLELRESNRDMMNALDRERPFGISLPVNKRSRQIASNSRGPVYRGWGDDDIIWQWQQSKHRDGLWGRLNLKTRTIFGRPWTSKGRPITPWGAPLSHFSTTPKITAVEHVEHKRVGEIERVVTDRVEFDVRDYAAGPENIRIVYNYAPHSGISGRFMPEEDGGQGDALRYVTDKRWSSLQHYGCGAEAFMRQVRAANPKEKSMTPEIVRALMRLLENSSVTPHVTTRRMFDDAVNLDLADRIERSGCPPTYRISSKGRVFVKAILALPMPVQAEPEWTMPPRS